MEEGAVRVEKKDGNAPVLLAVLDQRGEFFGEMSLIDTMPRSADLRADRDARVLAFPRKELTSFLRGLRACR